MPKPKITDEQAVADYMAGLDHPLKPVMEAVRERIRGSHPDLKERIKWAAPSYHLHGQDLVTFNPRTQKHVHLVFHHAAIVQVASPLLEGDYKDRRMVYFESLQHLAANDVEFRRIMQAYTSLIS